MPRVASRTPPRAQSEHAVAFDLFHDEDRGITNNDSGRRRREGGVCEEGVTVSTSTPHRLLRSRSPHYRPSGSSSALSNLHAIYREVRRCLIPVLSAAMLVALFVVRGTVEEERKNMTSAFLRFTAFDIPY